MLSLGTWAFGLAGAIFGGFVSAGWRDARPEVEPEATALIAPPMTAPDAAPAGPPALQAIEALPAVNASAERNPPRAQAAIEAPAGPSLIGAAARIVDGDTFYIDGVKTRLRLWGIDAPEKNAPGAAEATQALTALLANRTLACAEVHRDRYARIVARCRLDDGRDVGRVMIDIGAATELTRYSGGFYGG
ncbi:MAG: thermonuclease family protein [Parvularculaceae bacterium]|nr:thermonuclease family protein [Parvularculaceae bacterium]